MWYRLTINRQDDPEGLHVHLDAFRRVKPPKDPAKSVSIEELAERLTSLRTAEIYVIANAGFVVPREDIPRTSIVALCCKCPPVPRCRHEIDWLYSFEPAILSRRRYPGRFATRELINCGRGRSTLSVPMTDTFITDFVPPMCNAFDVHRRSSRFKGSHIVRNATAPIAVILHFGTLSMRAGASAIQTSPRQFARYRSMSEDAFISCGPH